MANLRINKKTQIEQLEIQDINNLSTTLTDLKDNIDNHKADKNNPHEVTKAQVGLGNVDNTSDIDKPISKATQEALDTINTTVSGHISDTDIHTTKVEKETWNAKQDGLTETQMAAVNSGITSEKVTQFEGKQDKLKNGTHINITNNTVNVLDDLSTYDNSKSGFINKDVEDLTNFYNKTDANTLLAAKADLTALQAEVTRATTVEAGKQDKLTAGVNIEIDQTTATISAPNVYSKDELDLRLNGLYKYINSVATYDALPTGSDVLPPEYHQLQYLKSNNLQFLDTNYVCNKNTEIQAKFEIVYGNNCVYGTSISEANRVLFSVNVDENQLYFIFGSKALALSPSIEWYTKIHTLTQNSSKVILDDVELGTYPTQSDFITNTSLCLFKSNDSSITDALVSNIYRFTIYESGITIKDYVPAKRLSDNAIGFYELIAGLFYESSSELPFVAGPRYSNIAVGSVYKVLSENKFYMWYNTDWMNVGELHKAGSGITITQDGTIKSNSSPDNKTISSTNDIITTFGVKTQNNTGTAYMYDWIGTYDDWVAGREAETIPGDWICWITDDQEEGGVVPHSTATWGSITGTLTNQVDLTNALNLKADLSSIPTKTSHLTNDSGFITKAVNNLDNYTTTTNLTTLLSNKQDKLTAGDNITIDDNNKIAAATYTAGTGIEINNYKISSTITVPTKVSDLTNDTGFITKSVNDLENYTLSSSLATVATSGKYSDLSETPTIPSNLSDLADTAISTPTEGQSLVYDSATSKWKNADTAANATWGSITGTLSNQTDLNNALKARVEHYSTLPAASENLGNIVQYTGTSTSKYKTGYFYIAVENITPESADIIPTTTNEYEDLAVVAATFGTKVGGVAGIYRFTYTDGAWYITESNDEPVNLAEYGISYNNAGTVETNDDLLQVIYSPVTTTAVWNQQNVQDGGGSGGNGVWGQITGTLSHQTDLAQALSAKANTADLANVATSGKYTDLTETPTFAAVATSGKYSDLSERPNIPTKTSDLTNDSGFVTKSVNDLTNYTLSSSLAAVATSGKYTDLTETPSIPTKTSDLTNDSNFITNTVDNLTNYTKTTNLAEVATSGKYTDLSDTPTIPTKTSDLTNDSNFVNKDTNVLTNYTLTTNLAAVATSGKYTDLSEKPNIPTKTSDLTNDSNFITNTADNLTNYTKTTDLAAVATSGKYTDLTETPTIPTKTSDLTNDSNFITNDVNNLTYYTQTAELAEVATSGSYGDLSDKPDLSIYALSSDLETTNTNVTTIEGKIPNAASTENQLADKAFVNSTISTLAARYITSDTSANAFATKAALLAGPYYYQGAVVTLANNDYAIVTADEAHANATTRYLYDGTQWAFQYVVNNTTFTQAQLDAINSTITSTKVNEYTTHVSSTNNPHNVTASQVGLGNVVNVDTTNAANIISGTFDKDRLPILDKNDVGLTNVDNTSDANKPISSATQTALDAKVNTTDLAAVATSGAYSDLSGTPTLAAVATSGKYTDLSDTPTIPTKTSDLTNDSNFITNTVNNLTNYTLTTSLATVATSGKYTDLSDTPTIPTKTSDLTNDSNFITKEVNNLTNYTITANLATVAISGKYTDLSETPTIPTKTSDLTNDSNFINKDVNNLTNYTLSSSLAAVATSGNYSDLSGTPTIPTKISDLTNDSDFINKDVNNLTNYTLTTSLAAVATSGKYTDLSEKPAIPTKTSDLTNDSGFITVNTTELVNYTKTEDLAAVATTGSYNSLDDKPDIPTKTSDLTNDSNFIDKDVNNLTNYTLTSSLAAVATSGNYSDLSGTPTIPTKTSDLTNDSGFIDKEVNNLTNYTLSSSLAAVATSGKYTDLSETPTIPTKTSDLTNDSNFITNTVNNLTNYTKTTDLSAVATSGKYSDLTETPDIPTELNGLSDVSILTPSSGQGLLYNGTNWYNGTLTSSVAWGNITGTLTSQTDLKNTLSAKANSADLAAVATSGKYSDLTDAPEVPSKTSDLENDSGFITSSSNITGNAATATKLQTARTISLTNGVTASGTFDGSNNLNLNVTVDGTKHSHTVNYITNTDATTSGGLDLITRQSIDTARSNKTFGLNADQITVEYTTDGVTWTNYPMTNSEKLSLFREKRTKLLYPGNSSLSTNKALTWKLRITISPWKSDNTSERYVTLDGLYLYVNANYNKCVCTLERSTIGDKETFTTVFENKEISGIPSDNIIYFDESTFGGNVAEVSNYFKYRLTVGMTELSEGYGPCSVTDIRFLGTKVYSTSVGMVANDHLYTWDNNLNATFPGKISATEFTGNATSSSKITWSNNVEASDRKIPYAGSSSTATEFVANYSDNFKYNPDTGVLSVTSITGNAATATNATDHIADTDVHVTKDQKETWNAKQDALPTLDANKFLTNNGTTLSWAVVDALPSQSGQNGKFLTTNGTAASWAVVDALPSQLGKSGKFLTTNGTTASWAEVPGGGAGVWGQITGNLSDQTDLKNALDAKQGLLTAGTGITLTENTISSDRTKVTIRDWSE